MRNSLVVGLGLVFAIVVRPVWAQEQEQTETPVPRPTGIVVTATSDGNSIRILNSAALGEASFLPLLMDRELNSTSRWLHDPQVQKELGILAEQLDKVRELREASSKKQNEMLKAMRDVAPEKRAEFFQEIQQVLRDDLEKEIKKVLLPHQAKRLHEVALQMYMKNSGSNALRSEKFAEMLGLSEKQTKELQKKQAEIQQRIAAELAKIRKEGEAEMMSVLTATQKKKLETLLGTQFKYSNSPLPGLLRRGPMLSIPARK